MTREAKEPSLKVGDKVRPRSEWRGAANLVPSDPGPGWLRSRFTHQVWPRPGHEAPCGRPICAVCSEALVKCEELHAEENR